MLIQRPYFAKEIFELQMLYLKKQQQKNGGMNRGTTAKLPIPVLKIKSNSY